MPGSSTPTASEKRSPCVRPWKKKVCQESGGDHKCVGRPQQIHDPGIQQEPSAIATTRLYDRRQGRPEESPAYTVEDCASGGRDLNQVSFVFAPRKPVNKRLG